MLRDRKKNPVDMLLQPGTFCWYSINSKESLYGERLYVALRSFEAAQLLYNGVSLRVWELTTVTRSYGFKSKAGGGAHLQYYVVQYSRVAFSYVHYRCPSEIDAATETENRYQSCRSITFKI